MSVVPGLEGVHTWDNQLVLNDKRLGQWPRYKLNRIAGLRALGDSDDNRDAGTGRNREVALTSFRLAATVNPARYLGREMTLGTIAAGKSADLVLLDANPLEDIANVRRIRAVITAGRFLDRSALDRLLTEAKAAAQQ